MWKKYLLISAVVFGMGIAIGMLFGVVLWKYYLVILAAVFLMGAFLGALFEHAVVLLDATQEGIK